MGECFTSEDYVPLFTAADIAQYSFLIQKSISILNLELSQSYEIDRHWGYSSEYYPSFTYTKDMIYTKEQCLKIHSYRNFLYNLHLDMPKERELKFKCFGISRHFHLDYLFTDKVSIQDSALRNRIYVPSQIYLNSLYLFVDYACKRNPDKLKILKWLLKFFENTIFDESVFFSAPVSIVTCVVDCMETGLADTAFVIECLRKFSHINWICFIRNPVHVRNILYEVHRTGRKPEIMEWCNDLIAECLFDEYFQHIGEVLKFQIFPTLQDYFGCIVMSEIAVQYRGVIPDWVPVRNEPEVCYRYFMLLYLFWFYIKRLENPAAATSAVGLVWRSVPDVFLSFEEIETANKNSEDAHSEDAENVYDFYCKAVGKFDRSVEPRSLQHNCRCIIRKILYKNNHWLPEGISQTGLPSKLQSYLNLEA